MSIRNVDPNVYDPAALSPRALAIFEFLIGYLIQSAYQKRGRQPRRTFRPMFATFQELAAHLDANFDLVAGKKVSLSSVLKSPVGATAGTWDFELPADWQPTFWTSPFRLLGQRFLYQSGAGTKGVRGKRLKRDEWTDRIAKAAPKLERLSDPAETLGALVDRVHEYLCEQADEGAYETADSTTMVQAPSLKTVAKRLRELGYRRGAYPPST